MVYLRQAFSTLNASMELNIMSSFTVLAYALRAKFHYFQGQYLPSNIAQVLPALALSFRLLDKAYVCIYTTLYYKSPSVAVFVLLEVDVCDSD